MDEERERVLKLITKWTCNQVSVMLIANQANLFLQNLLHHPVLFFPQCVCVCGEFVLKCMFLSEKEVIIFLC